MKPEAYLIKNAFAIMQLFVALQNCGHILCGLKHSVFYAPLPR